MLGTVTAVGADCLLSMGYFANVEIPTTRSRCFSIHIGLQMFPSNRFAIVVKLIFYVALTSRYNTYSGWSIVYILCKDVICEVSRYSLESHMFWLPSSRPIIFLAAWLLGSLLITHVYIKHMALPYTSTVGWYNE